ncbi:hypothetical protein Megpolyxen_00835 [Candidatus Megaera polyxenophila]|nr:hypothetical protein Megpolyxen_00835 [Candidatus Megaera polyxenophila]
MGFIYYLCCCFQAIFDCLTCCFRKKDSRPSLSDLMSATNTNEDSQRKKSEDELIILSPTVDDEKSSPIQKFEHKEFKPRLGLVIPESFDRLDELTLKDPKDKKLIQRYEKLLPAIVSEKILQELWTNGSKVTNEQFNSFLILSIELYNNNKINQYKLIDTLMKSLTNLAETGSTEKFKLLLSAVKTHLKIDQINKNILISDSLLASSRSGSIKILQEMMIFISKFPKEDQEYILKYYPSALEIAAKNGHTDFIKELTSYFCKIVPDDRRFFEQAKTKAIMSAKSLYDAPKNQEKVLKTLESLKYEPQRQEIIIDLTTALTTTAPEPVLSIREALESSPPSDLSNPQESTVDQIGDLEGASMYVC